MAVCLLVTITGSARAATLVVTTTSDTSTPDDGICSLREAVTAANAAPAGSDCGATDAAGNTIVLPASASPYELTAPIPVGDNNTGGDLNVTGSAPLVIQGAGAGQTTIDASGLNDRVLHVFAGATVTVTGLTLTGGHAPDGKPGQGADTPPPSTNASTAGDPGKNGGAIVNDGTLTLSEVVLTANRAGDGGTGGAGAGGGSGSGSSAAPSAGGAGGSGGAIFSDGTLSVDRATFSANHAGGGGRGGGGVAGPSGSGISGASAGAGGGGGAIENSGGDLTVRASLFIQNAAGVGGIGGPGGINFVMGQAPSPGGRGGDGGSGGAIGAVGGNTAVQDSTLVQSAGGAGGNGGGAGVDDTSDSPSAPAAGSDGGNGSSGGAIFLGGGNVIVVGSDHNTLDSVTVTADRPGAPGAAGPANGSGTPGQAGAASGAGGVVATSPFSVTLINTLLSQNPNGNCGGGVHGDAGDLSFGDGTCPGTFLGGNPRLDAPEDNGGPTQTVALGTGSAAIDAGESCPATDQRGVARPVATACDIGAYELAAPIAAVSAADGISTSGATLHGLVNPNEVAAGVHFEYGTTIAYGQSTGTQTIDGIGQQTLSPAAITGLTPGTTYHFSLVATSTDGTVRTADATFITNAAPSGGGGPGGPGQRTSAPPALSHLTINPGKLVRRGRHHVTIAYVDSAAARTTIVLLRRTSGVQRGKRCVAAGRRPSTHRCTRLVRVGSLSHADRIGRNRLHLTTRLGRVSLPVGTYVLRFTPRLRGRTGQTRTLRLRVV
jgi:CSLREA domain-containing protein